MNELLMKYFQLIGEINNIINKAQTVDEAYKLSLKLLINKANATYATIWYKDDKDILRPYYSICPLDLTNISFNLNESILGDVYLNNKKIIINDYKNNKNKEVSNVYKGIDVSSYICLPIISEDKNIGVLELISEKDKFNDEEIEIIEMMPTIITLRVKSSNKFSNLWEKKEPLIIVNDIKKSFKNGDLITNVLKGINLNVYKGEFVVFLGESGCGKSTLLNIVGGMDVADSGYVVFNDLDLSKANEKELTSYRRNNIGFIFQSYNLMPNLNVEDNLRLIAELVSNPLDINEILKLVGLYEKRKNYPSQLSGGQQQRVSIARAIVNGPPLLIADEPTGNLDPKNSLEVMQILEQVNQRGITILVSTHDHTMVNYFKKRVITLDHGQIVRDMQAGTYD